MNTDKFFIHPAEAWDSAKCTKLAKRRPLDGLGSKGPQGYVPEVKSGPRRYNGGCIIGCEWFPGETFALPAIPEGFRFEHVSSWGWFIRKN